MSLSPELLALRDALTVVDEREPFFVYTLNVATKAETNAHEHWRGRAARARSQRLTAALAVRAQGAHLALLAHRALIVTLTRVAPRRLDSDNAAGATKSVRDGVADALGIRDNDPRVLWVPPDQAKGTPGVRIAMYAAGTWANSRESAQPAEMVHSAKRRNGGAVAARTIDSDGGVENDSED